MPRRRTVSAHRLYSSAILGYSVCPIEFQAIINLPIVFPAQRPPNLAARRSDCHFGSIAGVKNYSDARGTESDCLRAASRHNAGRGGRFARSAPLRRSAHPVSNRTGYWPDAQTASARFPDSRLRLRGIAPLFLTATRAIRLNTSGNCSGGTSL